MSSQSTLALGSIFGGSSLVSLQLSYSTADIQHAVFFGDARKIEPRAQEDSAGTAKLLVVNGVFFALDEQTTPAQLPPFTQDAALSQLVDQGAAAA